MRAYRIRLRPHSPWLTPWHADTLFGCLCWRYSELAGGDSLRNWLDAFRAGEPPFVISDAFPDGWLPTPALAGFQDDLKHKNRTPALIGEQVFDTWRREPRTLTRAPETPSGFIGARGLHVTLDRNTDTPLDPGGLFELEAEFTGGSAPDRFSIFVAGSAAIVDTVHACIALQGMHGFGKRSSAGFGAFSVGPPEPCALFDPFEGANGFVALSHFVPAPEDPRDGAWTVRVKYPKFQGNMVDYPFKGRLLAIAPGAAFRTGGPPRHWYGRGIEIERSGYVALHYGFCLAAPAILPGRGAP